MAIKIIIKVFGASSSKVLIFNKEVIKITSADLKSKYATETHELIFDEKFCKACDLCAFVCPKKVLQIDKSRVNEKGYNPMICIDIENCIACGMCGVMCPDSVITIKKQSVSKRSSIV